MQVVILAGGLGTRISEETSIKPKPMVEIGGKPIIWHIMKMYSYYGINEFIICCGYKGNIIKEYFANYFMHMTDVTYNIENNEVIYHNKKAEPWVVTLIDTGEMTQTGGRIKRICNYIKNENFCMTYGDGLSDVDISKVITMHEQNNKLVTMTAVQPPGRFGALELEGNNVANFLEKPVGDGGWINGGFFVVNKEALKYIKDDSTAWENEPLQKLAEENHLQAYLHNGFWRPMDTLRDKTLLEEMWSKNPLWKKW